MSMDYGEAKQLEQERSVRGADIRRNHWPAGVKTILGLSDRLGGSGASRRRPAMIYDARGIDLYQLISALYLLRAQRGGIAAWGTTALEHWHDGSANAINLLRRLKLRSDRGGCLRL